LEVSKDSQEGWLHGCVYFVTSRYESFDAILRYARFSSAPQLLAFESGKKCPLKKKSMIKEKFTKERT
jgi:hypothetical protein